MSRNFTYTSKLTFLPLKEVTEIAEKSVDAMDFIIRIDDIMCGWEEGVPVGSYPILIEEWEEYQKSLAC